MALIWFICLPPSLYSAPALLRNCHLPLIPYTHAVLLSLSALCWRRQNKATAGRSVEANATKTTATARTKATATRTKLDEGLSHVQVAMTIHIHLHTTNSLSLSHTHTCLHTCSTSLAAANDLQQQQQQPLSRSRVLSLPLSRPLLHTLRWAFWPTSTTRRQQHWARFTQQNKTNKKLRKNRFYGKKALFIFSA